VNVDSFSDTLGDDIGTGGLGAPTLESLANPLAVTLIDADGTRHVFQPRGISAMVQENGGHLRTFEICRGGARLPSQAATAPGATAPMPTHSTSPTSPPGVDWVISALSGPYR
jgi:hypothetical protein